MTIEGTTTVVVGPGSTDQGRPPVVEAQGVSVNFGGVKALTDVDLVVRPLEITGLVGPNGAGKTSLFAVLSGLLRPAAGRVLMDGEDVTTRSPRHLARRGMARTFQRPQLFAGLTVRDHLSLAYRLSQGPARFWLDAVRIRRERADAAELQRIEQLAELFDLQPTLDVHVDNLGLGTARIVELARGLAARPRVLLLDEPSSGLHTAETEQLANALRTIQRSEGVALLLVEHDLELVLALSNRVYVLDFGQVIAEGAPADIRNDPDVQAAYLGVPT